MEEAAGVRMQAEATAEKPWIIGTEAPRILKLQELGGSRSHGLAMRGTERS